MRVLILGGTVFLGRALVQAATAQGHDVAILSRGRSGPDPDGVEVFRGDRDQSDGLRGLDGQTFDVVVDTTSQDVDRVRRAVEALGSRTGRYVFTSTVSVYRSFAETGMTEAAPTFEPRWPGTSTPVDAVEEYGASNVACERVVLDTMGDRGLVVRPGLIVGDHDPSDRFGYWPARMLREGPVLAPGGPGRPVQVVDVRDLAEFVVGAASAHASGTYNAVGPADPLTMGELLHACQEHVGSSAELVWVEDDFLTEREVQPYLDLPLWIPDDPDDVGFSAVDASRAVSAGLAYRSLADTIEAALRTERHRGLDRDRRAGLSPARERELLEAWQAR